MLCELKLSNFVLIEEQVIQFGPGLNVITGETGAGKSVILQALNLLLGGRPKAKYLRAGAEAWELQALFCLRSVPESIVNELPEIAAGEELSLSRSMTKAGRGRVLINGRIGTVGLLEEISQKLINVCGQGQHVQLLNSEYQLNLIDYYGENSRRLSHFQKDFWVWKKAKQKLEELEIKLSKAAIRRSELCGLLQELNGIDLDSKSRESLEGRISFLSAQERAVEVAKKIEGFVTGVGLEPGQGILELLSSLGSSLEEFDRLSPIEELRKQFSSVCDQFNDFDKTLSLTISELDCEPVELEECRTALSNLAALERKFQTNSAGLLELRRQAQAELDELEDTDGAEALREEVQERGTALEGLARKLTQARKKAIKRMVVAVQKELAELNMPGAVMDVEVTPAKITETGQDKIEFKISTNPGTQLQSMRKIVSGGELARILLVLKKVLRDKTGVNVLVFDEVDSGVSGRVARAVGEKLKSLAENSQVICITHLPQVASLAERHILVEKPSTGPVLSIIKELGEEARVDEVARMLSGHEITPASRASAKELLASKA